MHVSKTKIVAAASTAASVLMGTVGQVFAAAEEVPAVNIGTINATRGFAANLGAVLSTLLSFVMGIAALAVFIYLIWGGIQWITSGGEKGKTEEARNKITSAVIGLIVLAASYALLMLLLNILGFASLTETLTGITPIKMFDGTEMQGKEVKLRQTTLKYRESGWL